MDEIEVAEKDADTPLKAPGKEKAKIISQTTKVEEDAEGTAEPMFTRLMDEMPEKSILTDREVQIKAVTIFRLPGWFHKFNEELCEPKMVAIGPYHRGKESLRTMEEHKVSTFHNLVERNKDVTLEAYFQAMRSIQAEARQCYSETSDMNDDEFAAMLLVDGCFILEWFWKLEKRQMDAICDVGWAANYIFSDMCLMENQIPFFVIHMLFSMQKGLGENRSCAGHCPLLESMFGPLQGRYFISKNRGVPEVSCEDIHHLLHLYYTRVVPVQSLPQPQTRKKHTFCGIGIFPWSKLFSKTKKADADLESSVSMDEDPNETEQINIPCATELHEAGVKFKRKKNPHSMIDISFEKGIIEMPFLRIQKNSITLLWNMVAFEQSRKPSGSPMIMSSYLALMDSLINTEKDISILERSGIVDNFYPNAEEASVFFNQFANNFALNYKHHYFYGLYKDVKEYSESTWHTYRARLMHDYFNNPWSIISVVAATILLILTFLQTYYSAK